MPTVGPVDTNFITHTGGGFFGPFFYQNPSFIDKEDFPDVFVVAFEWDNVGDKIIWKIFRSIDGGNSWTEQDAADRPVLNSPSSGLGTGDDPPGAGCAQDATKIHLVLPESQGNDVLNDIDLRYYTFDMAARQWSALITSLPETIATSDFGNDHGKFCIALRSDGDLVVAYQRAAASSWHRTWLRVWDGSAWTSAISVGDGPAAFASADHDAATGPESMVVAADDRIFLAGLMVTAGAGASSPYNHSWVWICVFAADNTVDETQMFVTDIHDVYNGFPIGHNVVGPGAYNATTGEVAFAAVMGLTGGPPQVALGMRAITGTASAGPTWSTEDLISLTEMSDSSYGLDVVERPSGYNGNGAAFFSAEGTLFVIWGAGWSKFGYAARESTGWTAPGYLNYIPTQASGQFPNVRSLSVAQAPNGSIAAYGWAFNLAADWLFYEELSLPCLCPEGGGAYSWGHLV